MNPPQRFRGTDAARLDVLAWRAADAAGRIALARAVLRTTAPADTASSDATLRAMEDWLHTVADDARRRAAVTRGDVAGITGDVAAGAGLQTTGVHTGPVVIRSASPPVLHDDAATGLHLQGYTGVGLAWRHVGTETRTVTTRTDFGDGWVRTDATGEHRAVFDVEVGAGIGPKRFGGLGEHRYHDSWRSGHTTTTFAHDGTPVTRDEFDAATTDR